MKKLWIEVNGNYTDVAYVEAQPTENCVDSSSSMVHWDSHGLKVLQYLQVRNILWTLLIGEAGSNFSGWAALSTEKKIVAAKWGLSTYAMRLSVITDEEDANYFKTLLEETAGVYKESLTGRQRIVEEMRQWVGLNYFRKEIMSKENIDDFYFSVDSLLSAYEGSNAVTFKQWLTNTGAYESNGFAQKSYFSTSMRDELLTIYNGGY